MVYKGFESEIFLLFTVNYSEHSEFSDQQKSPGQSSHYYEYISAGSNNNSNIPNSTSPNNNSSNSDNILFTPTRTGVGIKILTPNQMFQRLPIALAEVKAVNTPEI